MEFSELVKARYSVRSFSPRPIGEDILNEVLSVSALAPTAKNNQPHRIYVIRSEENLAKLRPLTPSHYGAPVILLFAYSKSEEWQNRLEAGVHSGPQDVSIVATHVMLKAADLGLGTVWVNLFPPTAAREALGLPEDEVPVLLMPIGYAAADAAPSPRHFESRPLSENVKEI